MLNRSAISRCEFRFPRYHSVAASAVEAEVGAGPWDAERMLLKRSVVSSLFTS